MMILVVYVFWIYFLVETFLGSLLFVVDNVGDVDENSNERNDQ